MRDYAILGGPDWFASDHFDVIAKALPGSSQDSIKLMLQDLIIERFKLVSHEEQKVLPVYVLVVGKKGARLGPAKQDSGVQAGCYGRRRNGEAFRSCHSVSMPMFVQLLPGLAPHYIDLPVLNQTELTGVYDFNLRWTPEQILDAPVGAKNGANPGGQNGSSIFAAIEEQLGLKLERKKEPSTVLVIDRVEREN